MSDTSLASVASPDVLARARKIKLFLMDVDGTITNQQYPQVDRRGHNRLGAENTVHALKKGPDAS